MALLQAKNITLSFGGLMALGGVSFEVNKGEVFSIIGPNGAGKTTIFNALSRFYNLDEGAVLLKGKDISKISPSAVAEQGIARTFQNIELFGNMTVLQNLLLGRHRQRRTSLLAESFFSAQCKGRKWKAGLKLKK